MHVHPQPMAFDECMCSVFCVHLINTNDLDPLHGRIDDVVVQNLDHSLHIGFLN